MSHPTRRLPEPIRGFIVVPALRIIHWVETPQAGTQAVLPEHFLVIFALVLVGRVEVSWASLLVPLEAEFGEVRRLVSVYIVG